MENSDYRIEAGDGIQVTGSSIIDPVYWRYNL